MGPHILNKETTRTFLEVTCLDITTTSQHVNDIVYDANYWQNEVHCLSYFAAIFLERHRKDGGNCSLLIDRIYELSDKMSFAINDCNRNFVGYLLRHVRDDSLVLEDILTEIQSLYSNYDYSRTVRM